MKRSPIKRKTRLARGGPIRKKQRTAAERERIYGPKERIVWVTEQPCAFCVLRGKVRIPRPSQNAHARTGGMGYKAGYETIVPLCARHHAAYDEHRAPFDKPTARLVIELLARRTEARWQSYVRSRPNTPSKRSA
jgi:hypothetical protein